MKRALLLAALGLSACQTMAADGRAAIDMSDARTRAQVSEALAQATGRAHVELGPSDGTVVTVLPQPPGPYEGNSPAMPIRFDIQRRGGECVAVRHDTGKAYALPGVSC
ncbi:hypothetical protein [Asticcacaulis solisilvae]|uniref:hypothetical protein n=1 Tax=Asticcacaulis solisilvae TaxID=1217274 RepID=UPI003FD7931A